MASDPRSAEQKRCDVETVREGMSIAAMVLVVVGVVTQSTPTTLGAIFWLLAARKEGPK